MKNKTKNLMSNIVLLLCCTLFSILGCTVDDENVGHEIENIKYGTYFGECYGYCQNILSITSDEVTLEKEGWTFDTSLPKITYKEDLEKNYLQNLFDEVNFDDFLALNDVIGCPDCADGGAEWIEITTKNESHKVNFEYFTNEIPELADILKSLRALNNSLQKNAYLVIDSDVYEQTNTNNYEITAVSIHEDILKISISSSGCDGNSWLLNLIDAAAILESSPIQRQLKIGLLNNELCDAVFIKDYEIDITELRVDGENELHLNIEGWEEKIVYQY